jgi:hypothetical protein
MKIITFTVLFFSLSIVVFAQDSTQEKLKKFDKEKYKNWKFENNFQQLDSSIVSLDTLSIESTKEGDIRVLVPHGEMAPMPNMEIRKDVKYTMQIKGYTNKYPYTPTISLDSLKIRTGRPLLLDTLNIE